VTVSDCEHCSLTQGFYGNQRGRFNGIPGVTLVESLLSLGNLVVGKPGASLTFVPGSHLCLIRRLPAGGPPTTLQAGNLVLGATLDGDCTSVPSSMLDRRGIKFRNVLLGQTITLSLNTRLDSGLSSVSLSATFCTVAAIPVPGGGFTPGAKSTCKTFTIPQSVLNELAAESLPSTVAGLLELANRALAGLSTGGATLSDINQAVDAINEGFDGCRFLINCADCQKSRVRPTMGGRRAGPRWRTRTWPKDVRSEARRVDAPGGASTRRLRDFSSSVCWWSFEFGRGGRRDQSRRV